MKINTLYEFIYCLIAALVGIVAGKFICYLGDSYIEFVGFVAFIIIIMYLIPRIADNAYEIDKEGKRYKKWNR